MNWWTSGWSLIGSSWQRAALAAAVAIAATGAGLGLAFVLEDLRQPDEPVAATNTPTESSISIPSPTERPAATETEAPAATSAPPTVSPEPMTPTPAPSEPTSVAAVEWPAGLTAMTLTDRLRVRSSPLGNAESVIYQPLLPHGTRMRLLEGPVFGGGYWWYRVTSLSVILDGGISEGWVASADEDGTPWIGPSPETCSDFPFPITEIAIGSLAELQAGIVAVWGGCVTTPWWPAYWVTITLRDDGTYSGVAMEGAGQPAFYYGTDEDFPQKRYELNDLQDSLKGIGQIDIVFEDGYVNRGELRNIKLMGNRLEFEFFHRSQYGPLTYRLYRIAPAG